MILVAFFATMTWLGRIYACQSSRKAAHLTEFDGDNGRIGSWTQVRFFCPALYIVMGLAGLPVFTGGGGPAYFVRPTFGFILGFLPAAVLAGLIARAENRDALFRKVIFCGCDRDGRDSPDRPALPLLA